MIWGWLPALLWVLFGSIFMGAVHDLGTLVVSLRSRGMTVGEIAGRVINPRVRLLFLTILLFALWIVLAIFGLVIAGTFKAFPESILPVFLQIPIAIWIGIVVHRRGKNLLLPSAVALVLMYVTVWLGAAAPGVEWTGGPVGEAIRQLNTTLASWPIWVWTAILLAYCYAASVMPVWLLLQPRDYINSLQLISSLGLIMLGLVAAAFFGFEGRELALVAPAVNENPTGAPAFVPFLFVTIACGAISGFHCLVSSGTSSKQLKNEADAHFVGYGSMLTEGFLAVLVIIAVSAGLGLGWDKFNGLYGRELWSAVYTDWDSVTKLTTAPFIVGAANIVSALHIDPIMSKALIAVLVASFAGTTLDTATRLQRYVVQELAATFAPQMSPTALPAEAYDTEFDHGPVATGLLAEPARVADERARSDTVRRRLRIPARPLPRSRSGMDRRDDRARRTHPVAAVRSDEPASWRSRISRRLLLAVATRQADLVRCHSRSVHARHTGLGARREHSHRLVAEGKLSARGDRRGCVAAGSLDGDRGATADAEGARHSGGTLAALAGAKRTSHRTGDGWLVMISWSERSMRSRQIA